MDIYRERDIEDARDALAEIKQVRCDHSWIEADNEAPYGKEICRICGKRRSK